jgi:hypothetical protein
MTNQFEENLNYRLEKFDIQRPNDKDLGIATKLLLIKAEVYFGEITVINNYQLKNNVFDELALCIYIECKLQDYSPEKAYEETIKQIELLKTKK